MYLFNKVVEVSECGKYAVMDVTNVPDGMLRGWADNNAKIAVHNFKFNSTQFRGPRPHDACGGSLTAVLVHDLKRVQPDWLRTNDDLLTQFEAMQQDKGPPIGDPVLLAEAKRLWSEKAADKKAQ